ncbi:hypothetical protein EW146_g1487 [Bondarzewia mesenterica]|uniref:REJ domain-containing protein n=1 Tax=Bondarzewia mesenterica TaxID=1095465 RepID=A0A4S4M3J1_9AGAM|nr:hypothetical protein EW146_g1487 [Bondarzewia mesenterica]
MAAQSAIAPQGAAVAESANNSESIPASSSSDGAEITTSESPISSTTTATLTSVSLSPPSSSPELIPSSTRRTPEEPSAGSSLAEVSSSVSASVSSAPAPISSDTPVSSSPHTAQATVSQNPSSRAATAPSTSQVIVQTAAQAKSGTSLSQFSPSSADSTSISIPSPSSDAFRSSFSASSFSNSAPSPLFPSDSKASLAVDPSSSSGVISSAASTSSALTPLGGRLQSTASISTSTVTDTPESTFATPISIPVTVSGHTTLTAPPLITSLATSTESNGSAVTVTHVIANPGGFSSVKGHSFFDHHGAVIAVFLISGIVAACLVSIAFCLFRRRHRQRYDRRLADPQTLQQNPFADPSDLPPMSTIDNRRTGVDWSSHQYEQDDGPHNDQTMTIPTTTPYPSQLQSPFDDTHVSTPSVHTRGYSRRYEVPFSDYYTDHSVPTNSPVGVAYSTAAEIAPEYPRADSRAASAAPSSPSIYPPSLPAERADPFYEKEILSSPSPALGKEIAPEEGPFEAVQLERGGGAGAPELQIADSNTKTYGLAPLTPPPSVSSHSGAHADSPVSDNSTTLDPILDDDKVYHPSPSMRPPPEAFLRRTYSKRGFQRPPIGARP